jgi:hypothetical protein
MINSPLRAVFPPHPKPHPPAHNPGLIPGANLKSPKKGYIKENKRDERKVIPPFGG